MNPTLDTTEIDSMFDRTTSEQRRHLLSRLLAWDLKESIGLPVLVANEKGEYVAYYGTRWISKATKPPKLTPEREVELQRRMNTLDDTISFEELRKNLGLPDHNLRRL